MLQRLTPTPHLPNAGGSTTPRLIMSFRKARQLLCIQYRHLSALPKMVLPSLRSHPSQSEIWVKLTTGVASDRTSHSSVLLRISLLRLEDIARRHSPWNLLIVPSNPLKVYKKLVSCDTLRRTFLLGYGKRKTKSAENTDSAIV
jgi:hypothetical protein